MGPLSRRSSRGVAALAIACAGLAVACSSSSTSTTAPTGNKCSITAATSPSSFGAGGGSGSLSIQTARDCTWAVAADSTWVSITGTRDGQGEAVVSYTVAPNPVPSARTASLTVGSERVSVSQAAAPCTFNLSSMRDSLSASGGRLSVTVTTLAGCSWSAASTAAWVTIASGQSGATTGTVVLAVTANAGGARVGTVNIAGQTYTVAQDAAPTAPAPAPGPSPSPSPSPAPSPEVTVSGIVLAVSGKCPDIAFNVGGTAVSADNQTTYKGGKCGDVKIGRVVTVTGTRTSNGAIAADVVEFNK